MVPASPPKGHLTRPSCRPLKAAAHSNVRRLIIKENYTWEDVVRECEDLLQMNGHAASPLQSNLPNVIRDLIFKVIGSPRASQPTTPADGGNRRPKPFIPDIDDIMSGPGP